MLKSGGQLELTGVITIELVSFHPSTATKNGFDLALEWPLEWPWLPFCDVRGVEDTNSAVSAQVTAVRCQRKPMGQRPGAAGVFGSSISPAELAKSCYQFLVESTKISPLKPRKSSSLNFTGRPSRARVDLLSLSLFQYSSSD